MNNRLNGIIVCFVLVFLAGLIPAAVWAQESFEKGSLEWYRNGPQKDWSESDFRDYYEWRERQYRSLRKRAQSDQVAQRAKAVMNGNKITAEIWNYGSISSPGNRTTDIVWEGLGYGYEFAPFISAEIEVPRGSHRDAYPKQDDNGNVVLDAEGDTVWVVRAISDGMVSNGGETSPDGSEFWGWEPLAESDDGTIPYVDPESDRVPTSNDIDRDGDGKPDSWPEGWYNPNLKKYVWPGALAQGSTNADMEAFFVVDDRTNKEFEYYPFEDDSTRKGLGLEVECRYYQWSNPLAEDIIFLIYKVTNKSDKDLERVSFGMWGDPHIGGPTDYIDDLAFFDQNINMVYAWDEDGKSDVAGKRPGYFGYKFLESPGNPDDGIDNDGDGMVDERRNDGIDNDGDWDVDLHDVGVDGVPNTGDEGEGDGIPTAGDQFDIRKPGEPNFEWTDLDESDMIGLTSFAAPVFGSQNRIANDDFIYSNYLTPGKFDSANSTQAGDNVFLYGSGIFDLEKDETRRFSIALLVGENYDDLTLNAETSQQIYEINYQFAKPPAKPQVTAVPGDEKVTLYWDQLAEESVDPISKENDFEGYVIYRSTDPQFTDQQTITDANGTKFLFEPLASATGAPARFDLVNDYVGLSDLIYSGRGTAYDLGNNTGLQHSFVDSNNVINGQTYYYAVVSYDHGDDSLKIAPTECSKNITLDPETNEIILDENTVQVVPRAPAAGYVPGDLVDNGATNRISHARGVATGDLRLEIIDPRQLEDENEFVVSFLEDSTRYTVEDMKPVQEEFSAVMDQFYKLEFRNINKATFTLTRADGSGSFVQDQDYELDTTVGLIRPIPGGQMQENETYLATYRYFAIYESTLLNNEESNPFVDGMKLYVKDEPLELDEAHTGWSATSNTTFDYEVIPFNKLDRNKYPADYEVRFSNSLVDSSARPGYGYIKTNFQVWDVTKGRVPERQRIIVLEVGTTRDSLWSPGERVIILKGDEGLDTKWEITFTEPAEGDTIPPAEGDVFYISTTRPFTVEDEYRFTTTGSRIETEKAESDLENIAVVPNPYVATNVIEPLDRQNPRDRGPRRLYFNHLPQECTIRIFTVTGELVQTLEHHSDIDDGKEFWDLTTQDNFPIAYGVYIYHVDAGELGTKIGRFAVIK
jgi:hypothetical protein